jgi:DNA topoisomerase I
VEQIIKSISEASKRATRFIHACDYDQAGEVIGYNILQYACKFKYEESLWAKFSTLTDQEIRESFDNLLNLAGYWLKLVDLDICLISYIE